MITDNQISINSCLLCAGELPQSPIIEGEGAFCCPGCQAVFKILAQKNQLCRFQEHPLFIQAVKSGLISNPDLLERIRKKRVDLPEEEWQKLHLEVLDMWCPSCAEIIRLILLQERGVKNCVVDYTTDLASIEFSPCLISKDKILTLIKSLGYYPRDLQESQHKAVSFALTLRLIVAAFCSLNVMMLAYPLYVAYFQGNEHEFGSLFAWLSLIISLPVISYSAFPIFQRFYHSLRVGIFGMEMLVVIGVSSSFCLSLWELYRGGTAVYFDSMTVIIAFVLLGKLIEAKAKFSTKEALLRLSLALPRRGRKRFPDGASRFVLMKELAKGDEIVVLTGEKIVLDGQVIEGEGACDESLMTGEAIPVGKKEGDLVIGGTILQQGQLVYRVSHHQNETALQKILDIVQQDIGHKSTYLRAVDPVVRWFVPLVVALAALIAYWTTFERGIAILLISCPCAIGIAVPLAEAAMINGMAALGAIVRNRSCLMYLGKEDTFIFDKTGSLTEGHFTLQSGLEGLNGEQLRILKGMTGKSNHLVSRAIHRSIVGCSHNFPKVEEIPGQGLKAGAFLLGSFPFLRSAGVEVSEPEMQELPLTYVGFAQGGKLLTILALGDVVRKDAKIAVTEIDAKTILLSGDGQEAVKCVAKLCQTDEWHAGCSPLQKRDFVEERKGAGEVVSMLGDGINDAAALTSAHVGISVVSAADISIQVSDILLTTDRLSVIPKLRDIARKGRKIIRQNLFWAFIYNIIGVGLAVFGFLNPLFSAIAMVLSSLIVIFNAKRLTIR